MLPISCTVVATGHAGNSSFVSKISPLPKVSKRILHSNYNTAFNFLQAPGYKPDFWRLLALLKEYEIPFTILGNPFHLNDEVCRLLKAHGCQKYQLSLDGMKKTHDWFRKPGSFNCTLEKRGKLNHE
nr:hypothetical protein [Phascolarctobacterium sp.]